MPKEHFSKGAFRPIAQWNAESDWKGDERNVVLALARIWYSVQLVSLLLRTLLRMVSERLPAEHRPSSASTRGVPG
ncbi:aminoglycoside adenylyltransferase domain-containing protein [Escherichia coli]|uniref:aminoglycoside adenylyltransferase domain-containing protein n=1 Tax=Escherichia coli TaxID=562 RepID=UPI002077368B|nr:aminoglycoside adenylyltransferase domain-containing protein [Escherichia coli]